MNPVVNNMSPKLSMQGCWSDATFISPLPKTGSYPRNPYLRVSCRWSAYTVYGPYRNFSEPKTTLPVKTASFLLQARGHLHALRAHHQSCENAGAYSLEGEEEQA